jgi:muramoyltetrapeptide carboxypeptidase
MNQIIMQNKCLGIWAPASPCDPEIVKRGIEYLHALGFKTKLAHDPSAAWGKVLHLFSSDTPDNRVQALYRLYEDPQVDAVLSVRGGYGTMELLPILDFERLSKDSKPIVGISDITVLLNTLYQRSDIHALHGAVFPNGFAKALTVDNSRFSSEQLLANLFTSQKRSWENLTQISGSNDSAKGIAIGGNLSMLAAVAGTPWEPIYEDQILFIEDIGEKQHRIHRMLTQLKLAGSLDNLSAVVIGEFVDCPLSANSTVTINEVFKDIFKEYSYPVLTGAPFGHGELNLPFRIGETVKIEKDQVLFCA